MQSNEQILIDLIRNSKEPERAIEIATQIITDFLKQL